MKREWLQYTDISLNISLDNPFVNEDPCLIDLFWRELEDVRVTVIVIKRPEDNLPPLEHFSGTTPGQHEEQKWHDAKADLEMRPIMKSGVVRTALPLEDM